MAEKKPKVVRVKGKPQVREQVDWSLLLEKPKETPQAGGEGLPDKLKKMREEQLKNAYPEMQQPGTPAQAQAKKKKKGIGGWLFGRE